MFLSLKEPPAFNQGDSTRLVSSGAFETEDVGCWKTHRLLRLKKKWKF